MENTYQEKAIKLWESFIVNDKIAKEYTPEEFMAKIIREKNRIDSSIATDRLCLATFNMEFNNMGFSNYFIANDPTFGHICDKCKSTGIVILITDKDYIKNMEYKIFFPTFDAYYALGIKPNDIEFAYNFPVPINYKTDYWYCPHCNELHKFKYDYNLGLIFDQEVVNVDMVSSDIKDECNIFADFMNAIIKMHD